VMARPAEWEFLASGGSEAARTVGARLAVLDAATLASPDRPSVV